nr:TSCPD domain-containing protein [Desulfitobacterium hafniense]
MTSTYKTKGVCASHIHFEIKENKLYDVLRCGHKATSCADQVVKALESSK